MPTDSATLSAREAFERGTITAASAPDKTSQVLNPQKTTQPAEQPSASAQTESQPAAETSVADETFDTVDSPTAEAVLGDDETVDSSAAADEADASDDSEHAELTDETADQEQPVRKPKGRAQSRIEDLVASNKALKASLDYLQNEVITKLQPQQPATQQPIAQPAPVVEEAPPTLESVGFDTDKWTQAMHAWTRKQIDSGVQRAVTTVQQNQTEATRKAAFESRLAAFEKAMPDLKVVLGNPALPRLSAEAAALVADSDVGPQILYHLGRNVDKAVRIARQTPVQQAAAIGRLEAELAIYKPSAQKKPISNISKAPTPPTPTKGNSGAPSKDATKMPIQDFIQRERAEAANRRNRR